MLTCIEKEIILQSTLRREEIFLYSISACDFPKSFICVIGTFYFPIGGPCFEEQNPGEDTFPLFHLSFNFLLCCILFFYFSNTPT